MPDDPNFCKNKKTRHCRPGKEESSNPLNETQLIVPMEALWIAVAQNPSRFYPKEPIIRSSRFFIVHLLLPSMLLVMLKYTSLPEQR